MVGGVAFSGPSSAKTKVQRSVTVTTSFRCFRPMSGSVEEAAGEHQRIFHRNSTTIHHCPYDVRPQAAIGPAYVV